MLTAVLGAGILAELGARAWLHWLASDDDFRTYATVEELRGRFGEFERFRVHRHLGFALAPGYERGPNRHNALGFRGDEFASEKPEGTTRIVLCGGSTTYGEGVVDYMQSLPWLLEQGLRAAGHEVQVINAGCPGWTSLETLINLETRLLELEPDWVVFCHGINDVLPRLVWPATAYRADLSGWLSRDEHLAEASLLERSLIARMLLLGSGAIESHGSLLRIIGDVPPSSHSFEFRSQRLGGDYPGGIFVEVPVERMLEVNEPVFFERNLRSFCGVARAHGVEVMLGTFPFSTQSAERPYIGHPAIRAAIERTNDIVRSFGAELGAPVADMAAAVTEKSMFTDGVHFTLAGNIERAKILFAAFAGRLK